MSPAAFGRAISDAAAKALDCKAKFTIRQLIENQLTAPLRATTPTPLTLSASPPSPRAPRGGIRAKVLYGGLCDPMQRNLSTRQRGAGA